jgi:hypothetical protein
VIDLEEGSDRELGESMPLEIRYFRDGYGLECIGTGVVTGEDLKKANEAVYSDERLPALKYQLVDLLKAERFDVSNEDAIEIAEQDVAASETSPNMLIAVVAERDLPFGIARMWEAFAFEGAVETMVFREREEALAWIKMKLAKQENSQLHT